MKTIPFPPLCPFGDSEGDAIVISRPSSKAIIWPVAKNHFLRVNTYEDNSATYLLGTRKEIQDDILESIEDIEDLVTVDCGQELLKSCRLARIAKALNVLP